MVSRCSCLISVVRRGREKIFLLVARLKEELTTIIFSAVMYQGKFWVKEEMFLGILGTNSIGERFQ